MYDNHVPKHVWFRFYHIDLKEIRPKLYELFLIIYLYCRITFVNIFIHGADIGSIMDSYEQFDRKPAYFGVSNTTNSIILSLGYVYNLIDVHQLLIRQYLLRRSLWWVLSQAEKYAKICRYPRWLAAIISSCIGEQCIFWASDLGLLYLGR